MSSQDPTASTREGPVRGLREDGLAVFRGIPFAAPPEGERRFQAPGPAPVRTEPLRAVACGPAPPQRVDALSKQIGIDLPGPTGEDCLHLNVWTPGTDGARRPVLVWLHGGAFATGSGSSPAYAGHRIATRGDVVVVTLDYRVGAFGFLHLAPRFGADVGANLGLLDQIAALQWVRREIAGFGGDPDRITLFGESAGAGSITALLAMPAARGLFARVVVQSAAADGMLGNDEAAGRATLLLEKLGRPDATLAELRAVPVEALLDAQQASIEAGPHRTGMFFAPVIDGVTLPDRPLDAVAAGSARGVDAIVGTTEEEMQLYASVPGLGEFPESVLRALVASRVPGSDTEREATAREAVRVYREALGDPSPRDLFLALETDLSLRLPAIRLAESLTAQGSRSFMYLFRWRSSAPDGAGGQLGSCHAVDLPFTFGCLEGAPLDFAAGDDPTLRREARTLSDRMIDAWTAFARSGDPGCPGLGAWPPYDRGRRATMILDTTCAVEEAPLERRRAVWNGAGPGR